MTVRTAFLSLLIVASLGVTPFLGKEFVPEVDESR